MPRNARAFQIPLNDEPVIDVVTDDDADSFDDRDSLIYQSITCDCGNDAYVNNRCTTCGAVAPWAAKLGCGT